MNHQPIQTIQDALANISEHDLSPLADVFQEAWLSAARKSTGGIKSEELAKQKNVGAPVTLLRQIGAEAAKITSQDLNRFLPLAELLWNDYGREGRIVASVILGKMELRDPERVIPYLKKLCRSCITWEDCDQLAMRGLEPIVRKDPEIWLPEMAAWTADSSKWVQRAGVTVVGRLPIKNPSYTKRCLEMIKPLLNAQDEVVRKAVSFAIRVSARGEVVEVVDFLQDLIPHDDHDTIWIFCDVIRNMTKKFLPEFFVLLPLFAEWSKDPSIPPKNLRSIQSAVKALQKV